jgi:hypothetical protein
MANSTGRRSALAEWITRPDNQLTTRVIVNRVWHYHFGQGLVATPNDFGKLGELPSHPELLDWLARRFVASGWSLKTLHRDIMLSATYRQTAHRAGTRARGEGSIHRTNTSGASTRAGSMRSSRVTPCCWPAVSLIKRRADHPSMPTRPRRSIYTIKKRNSQNEFLRGMDAPAGFSSTSERQSTTTPDAGFAARERRVAAGPRPQARQSGIVDRLTRGS